MSTTVTTFFNKLIASFFLFLLSQSFVLADGCTGNCIDGQGTFITKEGDKYTGDFKHGEPDFLIPKLQFGNAYCQAPLGVSMNKTNSSLRF
jgi:hypothetical protein